VAFGRVLTDGVFKALVFDVIVAPDVRGAGLGHALIRHIVADPQLSAVRDIELYCREELIPFYERLGFSVDLPEVRFMRRRATAR
jgi:predicted GNAT family N-acyltransferase